MIQKLPCWSNVSILNIKLYRKMHLNSETLNTFANTADPDQADLVRAAWSGSTLFAYENTIWMDPALVDLTGNCFARFTNVKVSLIILSGWS